MPKNKAIIADCAECIDLAVKLTRKLPELEEFEQEKAKRLIHALTSYVNARIKQI